MSKRKRQRTIDGPFVAVRLAILDLPAWRMMSPVARLLWIELRRELSKGFVNNGKIFLSCRDAAKKLDVHKDTICSRYFELEHYGFLRKTTGTYLGLDGRGLAPHYRFTDLAHGTHPATRDYEKWDGSISEHTPDKPGRKKQNPVLFRRTPRPTEQDTQDIRKTANDPRCPTEQDIDDNPRCPTEQDISRFAIPMRTGEAVQGSSTVRAPARAGGAGSSPAPVANGTQRGKRASEPTDQQGVAGKSPAWWRAQAEKLLARSA